MGTATVDKKTEGEHAIYVTLRRGSEVPSDAVIGVTRTPGFPERDRGLRAYKEPETGDSIVNTEDGHGMGKIVRVHLPE